MMVELEDKFSADSVAADAALVSTVETINLSVEVTVVAKNCLRGWSDPHETDQHHWPSGFVVDY